MPDAILSKFPGPVTLFPSRTRWFWVLLGCMIFVAGGIHMIAVGAATGWLVAGFFGLGTVVAAVMLLPGAGALKLDRDGFEVTSLYRRHRTRWQDATGFEAVTVAVPFRVQRMVAYDDVNLAGQSLAKLSVAIAGHNAGLPDTYGLAVDDLAGLLKAWRARATGT
jgi:hypothetical protein